MKSNNTIRPRVAPILGRRRGSDLILDEDDLRSGVTVSGPSEARAGMLQRIVREVAAQGGGLVDLRTGRVAGGLGAAAGAAGRQEDHFELDFTSQRPLHFMNPFAEMSATDILRLLFAASPTLSEQTANPVRARASALLRGVVPALVWKRDEGLIDLNGGLLRDNCNLSKAIDLANPEREPDMPFSVRGELDRYLTGLPGFSRERGHKQSVGTCQDHENAAGVLRDALSFVSCPTMLTAQGDVSLRDVLDNRRIVGIVLPQDPMPFAPAFVIEWLVQGLPASTSRDRGSRRPPFVVVADGVPDGLTRRLRDLTMAETGMEFAVVVGTEAETEAPGTAIRLTRSGGAEIRKTGGSWISFTPDLVTNEDMTGTHPPRRVPIAAPHPSDVVADETLPLVAMALADHEHAKSIADEARAARTGIEEAAAGTVDPSTIRQEISAVAVAIVRSISGSARDKDPTGPDYLQGACASVAGVLAGAKESGALFIAAERARQIVGSSAQNQNEPLDFEEDPPPPLANLKPQPAPGTPDFDQFEDTPAPAVPRAPAAPPEAPSLIVVHERHAELARLKDGGSGAFKRCGEIAGVDLPILGLDSPKAALEAILKETPHLSRPAERILTEAASQSFIRWKPILLVGDPGAGKTRFAKVVCRVLGLHSIVYPCGGSADSSFMGTSKQWSSARPSIPLQAVGIAKAANPCIILDDLARAGTGSLNGNFTDAILAFTERESSKRFFDLGLDDEVDLSRVLWIATANDIARVDAALLDRFRTVNVECPGLEHGPVIVRNMLRDLAEDRGMDPAFACPLSADEIETVIAQWGGGSLRKLQRTVERAVEMLEGMAPNKMN